MISSASCRSDHRAPELEPRTAAAPGHQAEPTPEDIDEARRQRAEAKELLEEQARQQDVVADEEHLPGGEILELDDGTMQQALEACQDASRKYVAVVVELGSDAAVQAVEIRSSSEHPACDEAVRTMLEASRWLSCQELGQDTPCRVRYALTLGSPLH